MRKVAIGIAAAVALAAVAPANAQGIWIGVPVFEIGIGTGRTYAYGDPYYGGYRYGPTYAYEGYLSFPLVHQFAQQRSRQPLGIVTAYVGRAAAE